MAAISRQDVEFNKTILESHRVAIRQMLDEQGFSSLPTLSLRPQDPVARPLAFVTGVNAQCFDGRVHAKTPTKAMVKADGEDYMLNQSAAFVHQHLKESNAEIIILPSAPERAPLLRSIFSDHPGFSRLHFLGVENKGDSFIETLYTAAAKLTARMAVSRIDLVPYDSFATGIAQPFKPIYAETPDFVREAVSGRIRLFHAISQMVYDLLERQGQDGVRVVAMTALAARRVGGNLLADAAHKQISTNYLETLANESRFHFPERRVSCVEIAPGIVDNGIYDCEAARHATVERASINGFSFKNNAAASASILDLPRLSPFDIGLVASRYLTLPYGEPVHYSLPPAIQELAYGGRTRDEFITAARRMVEEKNDHVRVSDSLPAWCVVPGNELGRFAPLRTGYQFIPMSPRGQTF